MPRPSREERQVQRHTEQALKGVDKRGRTRGGAKVAETLKGLEEKQPGAVQKLLEASKKKIAPKSVNGENIYSGSWRGFENTFASQWWDRQPKPWTCYLCKKPIVKGAAGADGPSIEHKVPWARLKTEIRTVDVCCNGTHWSVTLTKDVRAVLQDASNLAPAHKGCNSKKNGPKDSDSIAPQRVGDCPGSSCSMRKGK
ncbi:hypothetical protein [Chondromyces crocatus]|uniref:Uncharacterized protein n=1 Tax=Chondromyces crocatus TaxID=52 RepID=A0A0K1ERM4_CHOCO|nr:hypothetical protein [Chondromyces crocatus]AKT43560.1 uncharacterized protein CMC5_077920 [Chondromyces crocatus]